jgi:glutamine amidotransferase
VHSYALPVCNSTIGTAVHVSEFSAAMSHENFHATQFHPERSSAAGSRLLKNFLEMK